MEIQELYDQVNKQGGIGRLPYRLTEDCQACGQVQNLNSCPRGGDCIPFLLPEDFRVWAANDMVVNHPVCGFEEIILPTYNDYMGPDGGYVAIYTRDPVAGLYSVGGGIYVMGQIRVQGYYSGRIFVPTGYQLGDNITRDANILEACKMYIPEMKNDYWVGGDTGGWFGIPG